MQRFRNIILCAFDIVLIAITGYLSLLIRFEGDLSSYPVHTANFFSLLPWLLIITIFAFFVFGLYRSLWEFAGITEMLRVFWGCLTSLLVVYLLSVVLEKHLPRSMFIIWTMLLILTVGGSRLSFRVFRRYKNALNRGVNPARLLLNLMRPAQNLVMIVGAGAAGSAVIRELANNETALQVVCVVDDDHQKRNMLINGVRVMGDRHDIVSLVNRYNISEIIVAIPAAKRRDQFEILKICKKTGARLRLMPSTGELISGKVSVQQIRDVDIEDLLGREEVKLDMQSIAAFIQGRTVLVTGGGGSIGSELCRQIAHFKPSQLIVLDIFENNMFSLQQELSKIPNLNFVALVGSVREQARLDSVFATYRPSVVFHAAAHKHVPLMEFSPVESVKNNVFGTYLTAKTAARYDVDKFVMISTDKAVNPTNVMGATKRMAEMIIQCFEKQNKTDFVAVRFGNVLGSDGSAIPLFRKQIAAGGPVTLTHPDITRFFMTIPEAARLVLQASALAKGGETFILDMGEPVRIYDLVTDLIRLSGLEPEVDIPIVITGLRPGEKLYEELLMDEEGLSSTPHSKIFVGKPANVTLSVLEQQLAALKEATDAEDAAKTRALLQEFVTTYHPTGA